LIPSADKNVKAPTEPILGVLSPNRHIAPPGRGLREWIARVPLLTFPLVALIPIVRSPSSEVSLLKNLGVLAVIAFLLVRFAMLRGKRSAILRSDKDLDPVPYPANGRLTWRQCTERLPFGRYSYLISILGFVVLCITVWYFPVRVPAVLGAPAIAFIGLAAATGVVAFFIILLRRISGVPGLGVPIILLWAIVFAEVSNNHTIRTTGPDGRDIAVTRGDPDPRVAGRAKLSAALDAWLSSCNANTKEPLIVIVATAGGASRAALWTASVLHQAEQTVGVQRFRQALFALSGVSGGSLGAAAYVASLPTEGCAAQPDQGAEQARWSHVRRALSAAYLGPPIAAYFSTDLLARVISIAPPDRAAALEQAWEEAFAGALLPTYGSRGPVPAHAAGLQDSFLSLWQGDKLGRFPLLFLNGTHADTGLPIMTAPVQVTQDQFPLALDLLDLVGKDVHLSTAVSNSARFPVVTPGGTLMDRHRHECAPLYSSWWGEVRYKWRLFWLGLYSDEACKRDVASPSNPKPDYGGYVMDGGYVENFGADTVRDLIADIDAWRVQRPNAPDGRAFKPHVLVIQISSDPSLRVDVVARCRDTRDTPLALGQIEKPSQAISDWLGPLMTVVEARGARGARSAGDLLIRR
jgi:hypothetical protein